MRLWSLHPRYLDQKGLTAVWREGLLAQAVLAGRTRGYTRHPQLRRFQEADMPGEYIAAYLRAIQAEAARGHRLPPFRAASASPPVGVLAEEHLGQGDSPVDLDRLAQAAHGGWTNRRSSQHSLSTCLHSIKGRPGYFDSGPSL